MSDTKPSFWHTLPGLLTGLASLLTALVAFMTFIGVKAKHEESGQTSQKPAIVKLQNLDHCKEFVGEWSWFIGGELRAEKNGYVDWRKDPSDPTPVIIGQWTCVDDKPKKYNISWQNGISDMLVMSPDKRSVNGTNSIHVQVSGTRKK